jgi:hypothetical protein
MRAALLQQGSTLTAAMLRDVEAHWARPKPTTSSAICSLADRERLRPDFYLPPSLLQLAYSPLEGLRSGRARSPASG